MSDSCKCICFYNKELLTWCTFGSLTALQQFTTVFSLIVCSSNPFWQKFSRFKGMLSVKFSDVSLAQKSSIFKRALSVMFGDVNVSGPDMLGAPKVHDPKVGLTNKIDFKKDVICLDMT